MKRKKKSIETHQAPPTHATKRKVARWGPYPNSSAVFGKGMGGYARYNYQALKSRLSNEFDLIPVRMSVPVFSSRLLHYSSLVPRFFQDFIRVARVLCVRRPDVLHVTALYWNSVFREFAVLWGAQILKVPVWYDMRAGNAHIFLKKARGVRKRLFFSILKRADALSAQGRAACDALQAATNRPVRLIPNCVPTSPLGNTVVGTEVQDNDLTTLRIVFVGYAIPDKGVDTLIDATVLLSKNRAVRLVMIGHVAPSISSKLSQLQTDHVPSPNLDIVCTGKLPPNQIFLELRRHHVMVFPSRLPGEGQPNAVTEAMAVGLPVIVSNQGFLEELVTPDCGIVLKNPISSQRLADAIENLTSNYKTLRTKGRAAAERIRTHYSCEKVLPQVSRIYHALALLRKHRVKDRREDNAMMG